MFSFEVNPPPGNWLQRKVREYLGRDLTPKFRAAAADAQRWAADEVRSLLKGSETYQSLTAGSAREELGLGEHEKPLVDRCVEHVADSVRGEAIPAGGESAGGVRIVMLGGGLDRLLAEPFAAYLSHGRSGVREVPWLKWLLTGGSRILLAEYRISYPYEAKRSRTESAYMLPGAGWRLPHAGSAESNWVTDALSRVEGRVAERVRKRLS